MIAKATNQLLRVHIGMDTAENKLCHLEDQVTFSEYNKEKMNERRDQAWLIDLGKPLPANGTIKREGDDVVKAIIKEIKEDK